MGRVITIHHSSPMHRVLVVYKKSLHQIYILERNRRLRGDRNRFDAEQLKRLQAAHDSHLRTLDKVRAVFGKRKIRFREIYRARHVDYGRYDFVIAVGGDGTFIEAARQITDQPILGVNSDPVRSVGVFCAATGKTFAAAVDAICDGAATVKRLNRMAVHVDGEPLGFYVLNDVLVAHVLPAAMSQYRIRVNAEVEEQKGSGIWVSTAAGSSGGIYSAGGHHMPWGSIRLQYQPRELFTGDGADYRLRGGIVALKRPLIFESRMREGRVFVDGPHVRLPFPFGCRLQIANARHPLRVVMPKT